MRGVKAFRQKGLLFPRRLRKGPNKGDLVWAELPHSRALHILHNPRYTGAFVYGRSRTRNNPNGGTSYTKLPREQWMLLKDAHPGYISWEQYEENLRRLRENAQAVGADRRKSPPREGPALLQGLVVCGICGSRMTVRYHTRKDRLVPEYVCQRDGIEHAISICQRVIGDHIDNAVGRLLVESVAPLALEVTLSVQQELQARIEEVDKLRKKHVERARYESDMAQRRYPREAPEITIREEAPETLRYFVLQTGIDLSLGPHALREDVCAVLRARPDPNNWSAYPNVWDETQALMFGCDYLGHSRS